MKGRYHKKSGMICWSALLVMLARGFFIGVLALVVWHGLLFGFERLDRADDIHSAEMRELASQIESNVPVD